MSNVNPERHEYLRSPKEREVRINTAIAILKEEMLWNAEQTVRLGKPLGLDHPETRRRQKPPTNTQALNETKRLERLALQYGRRTMALKRALDIIEKMDWSTIDENSSS